MYRSHTERLENGRYWQTSFTRNGEPLSYLEVIALWQRDGDFRTSYLSVLADAPFAAFRWETPPVTRRTAGRPFEFVLFDASELLVSADAAAFAGYCTGTAADECVVGFSNLGKDAYLLAPCQRGPLAAYAHLAVFTREAPDWQNHALWIMAGQTLEQHVTDRPVWLNTAGMGVSWLHVRLDSRPKYYGFAPYRTFP